MYVNVRYIYGDDILGEFNIGLVSGFKNHALFDLPENNVFYSSLRKNLTHDNRSSSPVSATVNFARIH